MTLGDLLEENLAVDDEDVWKNERTPTAEPSRYTGW